MPAPSGRGARAGPPGVAGLDYQGLGLEHGQLSLSGHSGSLTLRGERGEMAAGGCMGSQQMDWGQHRCPATPQTPNSQNTAVTMA